MVKVKIFFIVIYPLLTSRLCRTLAIKPRGADKSPALRKSWEVDHVNCTTSGGCNAFSHASYVGPVPDWGFHPRGTSPGCAGGGNFTLGHSGWQAFWRGRHL